MFSAQRLFAIQETGSCELKSLTVAVNHLLNSEVSYQTLILNLIENTLRAAKKDGQSACLPSLAVSVLKDDASDVRRRLNNALRCM